MVGVQEATAALPVCQFRVDPEARSYRIVAAHFLGRANVKRLWKLLASHRTNVDVAMSNRIVLSLFATQSRR